MQALWIKGVIGVLVTQIISCQDSNFSGRGGKKTVDPTAARGSGASPEGDDPTADGANGNSSDGFSNNGGECDPVFGKTKAQLKTERVSNGQPGNYIEFSLSLADCSNKAKVFSATTVYFDLDAFTSLAGLGRKLPFTLKTDQESQNGFFSEIQGEDLFGKTGPERYHYRSDREIQLKSSTSSLTMKIELLGMRVTGDKFNAPSIGNSFNQVPIYMRFGKATPVKAEINFD